MDENKDYTKKNYRLKVFGTLLTALGFIAIIFQMCEFQTQNESLQLQSELLNRSLVQTYRPIGYLANMESNLPSENYSNLTVTWHHNKLTLQDSVTIYYQPYLFNEGSGVLVYIGHLNFMTDKEYSFRERIQKGLISPNQIQFDWNYSRVRQASLLPKKFNQISMQVTDVKVSEVKITDLDKNPFYYLYALTLYEDQDGNLYDTETIIYFEMEFNIELNEANLTKIHGHDIYSSYSDEEKSILLELINKLEHPMVNYFSKNTQAEQKVVKQ